MRLSSLVRVIIAAVALHIAVAAAAETLDKAILNSAVWISYETPAAQRPTPAGGTAASSPAPAPGAAPGMMFGGTGFLMFNGVGLTRAQIFLITNKHVLPPEGHEQDVKLRVVVRDSAGATKVENVSVPIIGANGKYLNTVRVHPDPDTDVAAVMITSAAFGAKFQLLVDAIQTRKYLDMSMLMTSEKMKQREIGVGTNVYLLGYPAAIFDPRNTSAILRTGIVATDPLEGFSFNESLRKTMSFPEHINGFLIDANVYPGSSGSLVVLAPESFRSSDVPATQKSIERHPAIMGIAAGSIPIFDPSLRSYERIGLGIVFSADCIRDVIQAFNK